MTNSRPLRLMPAEWEMGGRVLLAWPHALTDWAPMLLEAQRCYVGMIEAFTSHDQPVVLIGPEVTPLADTLLSHIPGHLLTLVNLPTNDTWTRDYGPIPVIEADGKRLEADFKFNGWGLKFAADKDNLATSRLDCLELLRAPRESHLSYVLEGGSIESDGRGTILTTSRCLLSPNRNGDITAPEVERQLHDSLGAERVLWLHHGGLAGDDTDGHIDTLARLAPGNLILYVGCQDPADEHFDDLRAMREALEALRTPEGLPYNLVELPLPSPIYDDEGERLPATYANFLITPTTVFMPTYGQPRGDQLARQILEVTLERPVVGVDCRALIRQHGSLHCATMMLF
ncbi:MAG: agmatine deiminase family protein [Bacteroidales bacterium]|nr:agmatine deiminase family protein [Bacteroidales bacterium]